MRKLCLALSILSILLGPISGASNTLGGNISGRVVSSAGAPLAGASVTLVNIQTGSKASTKADHDGFYRFPKVAPGRYRLRVELRGYLPSDTLAINVSGSSSIEQDVTIVEAPEPRENSTRANKSRRKAGKPPSAEPDGSAPLIRPNYATVKIFYATDRKASGKLQPSLFYGGDRADDEALSYGTCEVSIPSEHRAGELEQPSILRLEYRQDPQKHVVLLSVNTQTGESFFSDLAQNINESGRKGAFVFIHGFNVTFEDAARRTAQLYYDLPFSGAPILYSWPSRGSVWRYTSDEATVEWSTAHLKGFLEDVAAKSGASTIHLIAHSMGNRALTRALAMIGSEQRSTPMPRFQQVVLAAPDVDIGVFKQLAQAIQKTAQHVTVYASSFDRAIVLSRKIHSFTRLGESGDKITVVQGIDTVDASAVDAGLLGHSYFGDSKSVLKDIFKLLTGGDPPDRRSGLQPKQTASGTYWVFAP